MNYREIIAYVVIGGLLFFGIFKSCNNNTQKARIIKLTSLLDLCQHAPVKIETVHDCIMIPGKYHVILKPIHTIIHDTIIKDIAENWYDTVYRGGGWRFRYRFNVLGLLRDVEFSDFVIPKEQITITRTVLHDTCITRPLRKFMWGLYTDLTLRNFKEFPGIGLGVQGIVRERLTLGVGASSLEKGIYLNMRAGVLF